MFDYLLGIGPHTWACIILLIVMGVGTSIQMRGTVGYVIGGLISIFAFAAFVTILAYRSYVLPGLNISASVAAMAVGFIFFGLGLAMRAMGDSQEHSNRINLRDRVPSISLSSIAVGVAGILVIVIFAGIFLQNIDFSTDASGEGGGIAVREFQRASARSFRIIERFLAR